VALPLPIERPSEARGFRFDDSHKVLSLFDVPPPVFDDKFILWRFSEGLSGFVVLSRLLSSQLLQGVRPTP
jgi:hypothetical protein